MLRLTKWDDLDYLIIDMPPGTGDIHLTVCQSVKVNAAVTVTTPQQLALSTSLRGSSMFSLLNIPVKDPSLAYFYLDFGGH